MSTSTRAYHHGDLRAALLRAASESLEAGEPYSMRSVARRAGVSPAAPYRHFADRDALDAAVAVEGFTQLRDELAAALAQVPSSASAEDAVSALGLAYVGFALRRPAVFRLMFGNPCDPADDERVRAADQLHVVLDRAIARLFPEVPSAGLSVALWSLAHGLAFLHLDGKLSAEPATDVGDRVSAAVSAVFRIGRAIPEKNTAAKG
ncbi:TetR family transcriptional regulator [Microbacterium sp. 8M]|uniref:TetR/AcrR family transcriptional regulator n=1 Tax=Microbacterium sp. 8M TaxID=2653153 RepID=UPI0012F467FA|nr:TetR/AcrR family transcriptional regulator [Microbacterium sp. 8M]VXB33671.1 TetR family transcriptional regulator [Microbacterium sp. 8M]